MNICKKFVTYNTVTYYIRLKGTRMELTKQEQDYLKKIGENIRKFRNLTGLSQDKFALKCKLDRTYISGIERGGRNVSLLNLRKIAKACGVTPSDLLNY
jgi:DNA-binding XRE family transcriptional regulator